MKIFYKCGKITNDRKTDLCATGPHDSHQTAIFTETRMYSVECKSFACRDLDLDVTFTLMYELDLINDL